MAEEDDPEEEEEIEVTLDTLDEAVAGLRRAGRRNFIISLVLLLLLGLGAGAQIFLLETRLADMQGKLAAGGGRANDDFARVQNQTAAMGASMELLHRDMSLLRGQLEQLQRQLTLHNSQ